ncbi:hypothetical protein [Streptomyces indicus]|uniref:Uncharacterized protein n=1 Tax=Streptomyces indicus TaxID=417292 RepID=A0A1G8XT33_9ACTN|nr:hypothetical protein [Streptomyces indicus]SDJ93688.1 hypothetical protein SAMN05421806_103388 [Streptomyces indicus]
MGIVICSLKFDAAQDGPQKISYGKDGYHLVRFGYGSEQESYDPWGMHTPVQCGAFPDSGSGIIVPSHDGWGVLSALVQWEADDEAKEYRARFVRHPLTDAYDSTATTDSAATGGGQYRSYMWQMFVHKGTPLGLKISARGTGDSKLAVPLKHAQFKLAIHTDVLTP